RPGGRGRSPGGFLLLIPALYHRALRAQQGDGGGELAGVIGDDRVVDAELEPAAVGDRAGAELADEERRARVADAAQQGGVVGALEDVGVHVGRLRQAGRAGGDGVARVVVDRPGGGDGDDLAAVELDAAVHPAGVARDGDAGGVGGVVRHVAGDPHGEGAAVVGDVAVVGAEVEAAGARREHPALGADREGGAVAADAADQRGVVGAGQLVPLVVIVWGEAVRTDRVAGPED